MRTQDSSHLIWIKVSKDLQIFKERQHTRSLIRSQTKTFTKSNFQHMNPRKVPRLSQFSCSTQAEFLCKDQTNDQVKYQDKLYNIKKKKEKQMEKMKGSYWVTEKFNFKSSQQEICSKYCIYVRLCRLCTDVRNFHLQISLSCCLWRFLTWSSSEVTQRENER